MVNKKDKIIELFFKYCLKTMAYHVFMIKSALPVKLENTQVVLVINMFKTQNTSLFGKVWGSVFIWNFNQCLNIFYVYT